MHKEEILRVFLDDKPVARSPYGLYGHPPMWRIASVGNREILARPGRTMERVGHAWREVDGVHWQERVDGEWTGQGYQSGFPDFLARVQEWRSQYLKTGEDIACQDVSPRP